MRSGSAAKSRQAFRRALALGCVMALAAGFLSVMSRSAQADESTPPVDQAPPVATLSGHVSLDAGPSSTASPLPGITLALYEENPAASMDSPALINIATTDALGGYTFVLPDVAADGSVQYFVRIVPGSLDGSLSLVAGGVASEPASQGTSSTTSLTCADGSTYTAGDDGVMVNGVCPGLSGAPALEPLGSTVDLSAFGAYGSMTARNASDSGTVDFMLAGDPAGAPAGDPAGDPAGAPAGAPPGDPDAPAGVAPPVITGPEDGMLSNTGSGDVTGTGEPGAEVTVGDDDGSPVCLATVASDGTWLCSAELADGDHTLTAMQTDPAGSLSEPSYAVTVMVDTTAPDAPAFTGPDDGTITNAVPVTVTGTGEPDATVLVTDSDDSIACTTIVDPDGTWSCPANLVEADHVLTAEQMDPAGNVSAPSSTLTVTVDPTPPAAPVIAGPADGSLTGSIAVSVTGTGEPAAHLRVVDDHGDVACTTTVGSRGSWSCQASLGAGVHRLTAYQRDPAGNRSGPSNAVTITIDTTPPAAPRVNPANGSQFSGDAGDGTSVTVTGADGPVAGCTAVPVVKGAWSCTPTTPLPPGTTVVVTAIDQAGNASPRTQVTTHAPGIAIRLAHPKPGDTQMISGTDFNPGETITCTIHSDPVVVGTGVAHADGTIVISFKIDGSKFAAGLHTVTLSGTLSGSVSDSFEIVAAVVQTTEWQSGGTMLNVLPFGLLAVALLVAGLAGVAVARRRRRD